jgi:hypothetical protein
MSDSCVPSIRTRTHGKKQLVLLRFEVSGAGGLVAAAHKFADAITQLRQRNIFKFPNVSFHVFSISECDKLTSSANISIFARGDKLGRASPLRKNFVIWTGRD